MIHEQVDFSQLTNYNTTRLKKPQETELGDTMKRDALANNPLVIQES